MGKLVAPIYMLSPNQEKILEFKGWNSKSVVYDGEMRDMHNLSCDEYPCLYQRKPRGLYNTGIANLNDPTCIITKHKKLAIISEGQFYYDGMMYPELSLSGSTTMVAINTKICFFPEKKYFSVLENEDGSHDVGSLEASYSATSAKITITTSDLQISGADFSKFKADDAVTIKCSDSKVDGVSAAIKSVESGKIVFPDETFLEVVAAGETSLSVTADISIERTCPDLDYVMESNNRLWGVSNKDNTIYACKLGDPTNWGYFQNTGMDSYYAEQGTDGEWTGCAAYSTHLLFFKEDYIHKVYGTKPSTYQIETAQCHALEKGSSKSIAVINETVLYKSRLGIMAYAGGSPVLISDNFGTESFTNAVAGTDGRKYYVSVSKENEPIFLVFDMEKRLWHKEDDIRAIDFCYHNGKLLFINKADKQIVEIDSDEPFEEEEKIEWMAQFGPFDEFIEERKVYSHLKMRLTLEEGASVQVSISIDGGDWERIISIDDHKDRSQFIPIVPRRCNKFSVKISGEGRCKIESLVRVYRYGTGRSDVR